MSFGKSDRTDPHSMLVSVGADGHVSAEDVIFLRRNVDIHFRFPETSVETARYCFSTLYGNEPRIRKVKRIPLVFH